MKLRIWAKEHFVVAQLLIVSLMTVLYFVCSIFGAILYDFAPAFDTHLLLFCSGLVLLGIYIHHALWRSGRLKYVSTHLLLIRNREYFFVIGCFILLGVHFGSDVFKSDITENRSINVMIEVLSFEPTLSIVKDKTTDNTRKSKIKRFIQKLQKKVVKGLSWLIAKFIDDEHLTKKIIFIVVAAIVAGVLAYLLVILYCSISCGGNPTLAILTLSLGILAIIFAIQLSARAYLNYWNREHGIDKKRALQQSWLMTILTIATLSLGFLFYWLTIS